MRVTGAVPNDLELTGQEWARDQVDHTSVVIIDPSGDGTIVTMTGGTKGKTVLLFCIGYTVVLQTSGDPNGFALTTDLALTPSMGVLLYYDDIIGSWRAASPHPAIIENRTSDPSSPVNGQMWIRTDL